MLWGAHQLPLMCDMGVGFINLFSVVFQSCWRAEQQCFHHEAVLSLSLSTNRTFSVLGGSKFSSVA